MPSFSRREALPAAAAVALAPLADRLAAASPAAVSPAPGGRAVRKGRLKQSLIRTIRDNHQWIAHYHTGGVPGRNEIDDTQEVNWRTVCQAIADTGFTGYVAHEFVPKRDPLTSRREAVMLCDV